MALPDTFTLVPDFAAKGKANGSKALEDQLRTALKAKPPGKSARAVAERLVEVVPWNGTKAISDEPDDSEMEGE